MRWGQRLQQLQELLAEQQAAVAELELMIKRVIK